MRPVKAELPFEGDRYIYEEKRTPKESRKRVLRETLEKRKITICWNKIGLFSLFQFHISLSKCARRHIVERK